MELPTFKPPSTLPSQEALLSPRLLLSLIPKISCLMSSLPGKLPCLCFCQSDKFWGSDCELLLRDDVVCFFTDSHIHICSSIFNVLRLVACVCARVCVCVCFPVGITVYKCNGGSDESVFVHTWVCIWLCLTLWLCVWLPAVCHHLLFPQTGAASRWVCGGAGLKQEAELCRWHVFLLLGVKIKMRHNKNVSWSAV